MHPLKITCILSWIGLLAFQLSLLLPAAAVSYYWAGILVLALLLPARGLFSTQRYTYKWIGFMTLFYFCVGVSELVSNPASVNWYRIRRCGHTASAPRFSARCCFYRVSTSRAISERKRASASPLLRAAPS
jgi:hypothetical protein